VLLLSPGNDHDLTYAGQLTEHLHDAYVTADRAYDAERFVGPLLERGCTPVVPPNPTRKHPRPYDRDLYKERALVEHFFQRIKRFRRIATRYDKLARSYLAFVQLAAILVWLL
jgi:putative transposase